MATITKELVENVKKYLRKYPDMPLREVATLCGTSSATVCNIKNGAYNDLLDDGTNKEQGVSTQIPYMEYKRLVACENAITELLNCTRQASASKDNEYLFIDFHTFSDVVKKHLPEEYEERRRWLYEDEGIEGDLLCTKI